jgi:hypothetical protein
MRYMEPSSGLAGILLTAVAVVLGSNLAPRQSHHFVDASGLGSRIIAPASYLGDWSLLENVGSIQYEHRVIQHSGSQTARYQVAISGPGGSATWSGPVASTTAGPWVPVTVPLTEEAWCVTSGAWTAILADVTEFTVEIELVFSAPDQEGLDNVVLSGTGGAACLADVDFDGSVGVNDFLIMLAEWGNAICLPPDLDGDGTVGILDFLILLAAWGPCP